jgi:hypothetical protein
MMKELKFENRYNKKGFLAKRERNRKKWSLLGSPTHGNSEIKLACFIN